MATLHGPFQITGTIDGLTYYKTRDGKIKVRVYNPVSRERMMKSPSFAPVRRQMQEFSTASKTNKLLRDALSPLLRTNSSPALQPRLTREVFKVIKSDKVHKKGSRVFSSGEVSLLEGFEFNQDHSLDHLFKARVNVEFEPGKGHSMIHIPAFVPTEKLSLPKNATHFKIIGALVSINFEKVKYAYCGMKSKVLALNKAITPEIRLKCKVDPEPANTFFLALGILFYQECGTELETLRMGNALQLIRAGNG